MTCVPTTRDGRSVFDILCELSADDTVAREQAARALALLFAELMPVIEQLKRATSDESPWVRRFARDAITAIGGEPSIRGLVSAPVQRP